VPALLRYDGYSDPSECSIHIAGIRKETKTAAFLEFWESFELREDLIRQAGKRYFNPDPPENAAKRYTQFA
jgi:hypothetical protein